MSPFNVVSLSAQWLTPESKFLSLEVKARG
jgi:hypothetical protein